MTTSRHVHVGPDALASLLVGITLFRRPEYDPAVLAPIYALMVLPSSPFQLLTR